jgi:type I restriction enzyme S subunit
MAKWRKVKLADVCKFVRGPFGGSLKKDIFVSQGYAVFEQQHAIYGDFNKFRYFVTKDKFNEMQRFKLSPGDLIMSCSGTLGKVALVPEGIPHGIINQALLKLTPTGEVEGSYIKSWFESDLFTQSLKQNSGGAAIQNVAEVRLLKEIEIPLPPLVEQRKIAEILRTWDEAVETAEAELKAKQELHQCLLQKAFSQGACIAAGEGRLLGDVVRLVKGKKPELHSEHFDGAAPYLVARFIRGEEAPQFASLSDKNAVSVAPTDIVIICDGSNSGEMFTGLDGVLSSTMAKLIPTSSDFEKAYVRYFVGYNGLRLSGAQEGGAIPHLDREKLLKFSIPVLEKKEQYLVVERLNASELAVQFVKQRTELLRAQKRGLMQKLLTGEVRVAA